MGITGQDVIAEKGGDGESGYLRYFLSQPLACFCLQLGSD